MAAAAELPITRMPRIRMPRIRMAAAAELPRFLARIQVPANFGRKHIGSYAHGNLTFKLSEGKVLKGNSMIMSLNSPIIDNLTTDLDQTSIDVDDFSESTVKCFIDACYLGRLEISDMSLPNFREINKMVNVFGVDWMVNRCNDYFTYLVQKIVEKEALFPLLQEAQYVLENLKKRDYLDLVLLNISQIANATSFVLQKLLEDLNNLSQAKLQLVVEIAADDVNILVEILKDHCASPDAAFNDSLRYFLQQLDFPLCYEKDKALCDDFFEVLMRLPNLSADHRGATDDLRMVFTIYMNTTKASKAVPERTTRPTSSLRSSTDIPLAYAKIVIVGDNDVGKTDLVSRYVKNEFVLERSATIGVQFTSKSVKINNETVQAQIWDTAGGRAFRAIAISHFGRAIAALLVYDVTNNSTFRSALTFWLAELRERADKNVVIMLVGNKSDLVVKPRQVTTEEGRIAAEKNSLLFMETSALESTNVNAAFTNILQEAEIWREYKDSYLEGYCDNYASCYFDNLASAQAACLERDDCGGITREPYNGNRYTLRIGPQIKGNKGETSWVNVNLKGR